MAAQRGNFIWYDVMTSEPKAATSFYSDVIGWDAQEYPMEDRTYTVFRKGPVMVAGLIGIPEAMRATGIRPCWSGYVAVDDVNGNAVRIKEPGGAIQPGPEDIPGVGRVAVAAGPCV